MDENTLLTDLSVIMIMVRDTQERVAALEKLAKDHGWQVPER